MYQYSSIILRSLAQAAMLLVSACGHANKEVFPASPDKYINGQNLLHYMKRVSSADDILPQRLFAETGMILEYGGSSEVSRKDGGNIRTRYYRAREQIHGTKLQTYKMNFDWNHGVDILINIDESKACITEEMVVGNMGRGTFRQSTLRHFAPGQIPPKGIRPTHDSISYSFPNKIKMIFGFDYSCASNISVFMPALHGWEPPEDQIALQFERDIHESVAEYLMSPCDKVVETLRQSGFECSEARGVKISDSFVSSCTNKNFSRRGEEYTANMLFLGSSEKNRASFVSVSIIRNATDELRR